jgi:hypothetical protein
VGGIEESPFTPSRSNYSVLAQYFNSEHFLLLHDQKAASAPGEPLHHQPLCIRRWASARLPVSGFRDKHPQPSASIFLMAGG